MCSIAFAAAISEPRRGGPRGQASPRRAGLLALSIPLLLLGTAASIGAQQVVERPLTLAEAIAEARAGNADLAVAESERAMAAGGAREAGSFLWPFLGASVGLTRSTDPVFAFGAKLRQADFAEADLALDALNDPASLSDWTTTLDFRWGALDPTRWAGRTAARRQADAAGWGALRARQAVELQAEVLYWSAVRGAAARTVAAANEEAARSTRDLFRHRQERGLLTEADRLQADAELAAAEAARIDAERAEHEAQRALGVFLGWELDVLPVPSDTLSPPPDAVAGSFDPAARADLRALAEMVAAREAERRRASLAYLPAIDAFGQLATHADNPGAGDDDWTVGVALRWTAFAGLSRLARRSTADAALDVARLRRDQAVREAAAEIEIADEAVTAAAGGAHASLAARDAAEAATGLVRRRFEEGLATATDLLQAEARRAAMRGRVVDALAGWRIAVARAAFVRSPSDPEDLP